MADATHLLILAALFAVLANQEKGLFRLFCRAISMIFVAQLGLMALGFLPLEGRF